MPDPDMKKEAENSFIFQKNEMPDPEVEKFENDMKNKLTDTFKSLILDERPTRPKFQSPKLKESYLPYAQPILPISIMNLRGMNSFLLKQLPTRVTKKHT